MKLTVLAAAIAAACSMNALAEDTLVNGPMGFNPIDASAYAQVTTDTSILNSEPWVIPEGFSQSIVSDESGLNIYTAHDWYDMNTVNETGKQAGRYMYRTHEVRGANSARVSPTHESGCYSESSEERVSEVYRTRKCVHSVSSGSETYRFYVYNSHSASSCGRD